MDEIVKQAIARWPNVPACTGWLGLDARGQWWMRDDRAQAAGAFRGGPPAARGSRLEHAALVAFIGRNYLADDAGRWFFQNGPQRVFVELEAAPLVWRVDGEFRAVAAHAADRAATVVRACLVDAEGRVYLDTDAGFGIVHSLDMVQVGEAVEQGRWTPEDVAAEALPARFGYVPSPAAQGPDGPAGGAAGRSAGSPSGDASAPAPEPAAGPADPGAAPAADRAGSGTGRS